MSETLQLPSDKTYRTIVADPPWQYGDNLPGKRGAAHKYSVMKLDDICDLPVADIADPEGSHLYLWVTSSFLKEGQRVLEDWGFTYKTMITWVKTTKDGDKLAFGMGHYFRGCAEYVLFGTRGRLPVENRSLRNVILAPRTEHSRKPDAFYSFVEQASPGPRLEMFARRRIEDWDAWGLEV